MLTLYFSPGACSMAAHIVLEESGEKYQAQRVNFADAEQRSEAYLKLNPQGLNHDIADMDADAEVDVTVR